MCNAFNGSLGWEAYIVACQNEMGGLSCSGVGRVRVGQLLAQAPDFCACHPVSKPQVYDDALSTIQGLLQLLFPLPLALLPGL